MKFTGSPTINLVIGDKQLSFQQDNDSMHVGTSVWPCSLVLSKFVERWTIIDANPNPYSSILDFRNKRGIELGTGCGVAGIALYLMGLSDIALTDIAPVMPALKHNLKRNKPAIGKMLKTGILYWNNRGQIDSFCPPFDIVIAADVVYIEEIVPHLVDAMYSLVADDGVVLLGYQVRSPEADKLFWEMCEKAFSINVVPRQDLHPDYAYEEADVYMLKKNVMQ